MNFEIVIRNGRWTINGKNFNELSNSEKQSLDTFFRVLKNKENGIYSRVRKTKSANNQNQ